MYSARQVRNHTTNNHIMDHKFLVEFGPNKHGRFKDTAYQETPLYDIISYNDGMRHSILPGDKVLAPWEPEGERYGPGNVLTGQEKRHAKGGAEDSDLAVSFYNGKTANIPRDTAMWIPDNLEHRVGFELKVPAHVRKDFSQQDDYPAENLPGYPTSGPFARPAEYAKFEPAVMETVGTNSYEKGFYQYPYFVPVYKVEGETRQKPVRTSYRADDMTRLIPGTEMTKDELSNKVMSQIMDNRDLLEDKIEREISKLRKELKESVDEKLSGRKPREFSERGLLEKSVTFNDKDLNSSFNNYRSYRDLEFGDSGHGSGSLSDLDLAIDDDYMFESNRSRPSTRNAKVGTDRRKLERKRIKRPTSADGRPMWRYWKNENAPELMESNHFGPYRLGRYEESVQPVPLESRLKRNPYGPPPNIENSASVNQYVNHMARHENQGEIPKSMKMRIPRPPSAPSERPRQSRGLEISVEIGERQKSLDRMEEARRSYKRQNVMEHRRNVNVQRNEWERQQALMDNQRHQNSLVQLQRDRARHLHEQSKLQNQLEARRAVTAEIQGRLVGRTAEALNKEDRRIEAKRAIRQSREAMVEMKQQEQQNLNNQRQLAKQTQHLNRMRNINQHMRDLDMKSNIRDIQARNAKVQRIEHFRKLENQAQNYKNLKVEVHNNNMAISRSQVLP